LQKRLRHVAIVDPPANVVLVESSANSRLIVQVKGRMNATIGHADMAQRSAAMDEETIGPGRTRHGGKPVVTANVILRHGAERGQVGDDRIALIDFTHLPTHCKYIALMPQWDFLNFLAERGIRTALWGDKFLPLTIGSQGGLETTIEDAFPKSRLLIDAGGGRFEVQLQQHGQTVTTVENGRHAIDAVVHGVRTMARLGVDRVLLTNAAGGLEASWSAGDLMIVSDHQPCWSRLSPR